MKCCYWKKVHVWNKLNEDVEVIRNKKNLICKGCTQVEGIGFEETFSVVSGIESIRMILALIIDKNSNVYQVDVKYKFLNGKLEEVYMEK